MKIKSVALFLVLCSTLTTLSVSAQTADVKKPKSKQHRIKSVYFSWGYNSEWYTRSTVHITQRELQNNYDLVQVNAKDHKGWNNKSIFRQPLTIPQYNYRLGFYINEEKGIAIEANFDHTKYIINDGSYVHVKGVRNNVAVDENILFSANNGFYWYLNNGANFLLFNFVKRYNVYHTKDRNLAVDFTGKAGVGPVIPHVENSLFGVPNKKGFQIGGWNTGLETALRVTAFKYGFLEFSQKVDYARYSNLKVASGTAKQAFGTYELILSAGFILPTSKHNPVFEKAKPVE